MCPKVPTTRQAIFRQDETFGPEEQTIVQMASKQIEGRRLNTVAHCLRIGPG
jgi:hypothetical protein